jgi:glutathione peroxidase
LKEIVNVNNNKKIKSMETRMKSCCCRSKKQDNKSLYDFEVVVQDGSIVKLDKFKGKVVLVVNTASKCGFTPQYAALEALYAKYRENGFEIIDIPCNQFGGQSPESDAETTTFCQLNYGTTFPQMKKVEVNGPNELPLYSWLKSKFGFGGFDKNHKIGAILDSKLSEADPDYAKSADIKWNFTKFLIDREGNVVARFEPTADMESIEESIMRIL